MSSGSYELLELLARGGMGSVYRARYRDQGAFTKQVALKVLRPDAEDAEEVGRRLRDEARLLGLLRHPAIVQVDRLAWVVERWALVMEYVEGLDLRELAARVPVPTGVALEVVEVVADALDSAARSLGPDGGSLELQHRDVKPGNIMLTPHGSVKLLDFGIAKARFEARESATAALLVGTMDYMAPERLAGREGGMASDLYSLGVVLWELLARRSFGRSSPQLLEHQALVHQRLALLREHRADLEPRVEVLLSEMLAWSPEERPGLGQVVERCSELASALGDPTLRSWCRSTVRGLAAVPCAEPDTLVGRVLTGASLPLGDPWSDVSLTPPDPPEWDDRTAVSGGPPPVPVPDPDPIPSRSWEPDPDPDPDSVPPPHLAVAGPSTSPLRLRCWPPCSSSFSPPSTCSPARCRPYRISSAPTPQRWSSPSQLSRPAQPYLRGRHPGPHHPSRTSSPASPSRRPAHLLGRVRHPMRRSRPAARGVRSPPSFPPPPIAKGLEQAGASGGVWQAPAQTEQVAWAEGLEVSLQGDASEVALVDEARGFPVPGVVPLGKWFVRARFGDAEPVVAGVVEIQGDEPLVLECKRDLGWCSVKR